MGSAQDGIFCDFCGEPKATPVPPDNTPHYLPGSKGSRVLNEHLRLYFVANKLLQCSGDHFLRLLSLAATEGGRGGRDPTAEACGPCNKIISTALQLHEQIGALQGRIAQLGKDLKGRISQNQSSTAWSNQLRELPLRDPKVKIEADPDEFISDREDFHFEGVPENDPGDIGDDPPARDPLEETEAYTAYPDDSYHCNLCDSIYKSLGGIKRHAQAHKESNLLGNAYECHLCRHPNLSEAKLRRHLNTVHGAEKGDLVFDSRGDADPEETLKPAPAEKATSNFSCGRCPSVLTTSVGWKKHRRMHEASDQLGNIYDCPHCRHPTVSDSNLRRHLTTVHRSTPHKNPNENVTEVPPALITDPGDDGETEKGNIPETDADFVGDIMENPEESEETDSDSDYNPRSRSSKKASPTKDGPSNFPCDLCESVFSSGVGFKKHLRMHKASDKLGNKYDCPTCRHPTVSDSNLRRHISTLHQYQHPGGSLPSEEAASSAGWTLSSNRYNCQFCKSVYTSYPGIRKHIGKHEESNLLGNLYDCPVCQHPTTSESNLQRHMKVIHGLEELGGTPGAEGLSNNAASSQDKGVSRVSVKKYPCPLCETVYTTRMGYDKHLRRHKESDLLENKYDCPQCRHPTLSESNLRRHLTTAHQDPAGENPQDEVDRAAAPKERKYSCPDCKSTYTTLTGINKHRRLHMESFLLGNLHDCKICGYPNTTDRRLHRHMSAVHILPNRKKSVELSDQLPVPLKVESDLGDPANVRDRPPRLKTASTRKSGNYKGSPSDDGEGDTNENDGDWTPQQESEEDDPDLTLKKKSKRFSEAEKRKVVLPHHCDQCNVGYKSARGYERHREEHLASAGLGHKFDCHCGFPASSEKRLRFHKRQSHFEGLTCSICGYPVSSNQHLKAHVNKHHKTSIVKRGRKKVRNALNQNRAVKRVPRRRQPLNPRQNRTCPLCQKVIGDATLMQHHLRLHEEYDKTQDPTTGLFHCPHCQFVTTSRQGLIAHKAVRHKNSGVNPDLLGFLCTQCGKSFYCHPALKRHVKNIHENIYLHKCDVCGKGFDNKQTFLYHKMTHEEVRTRSFICDLCGASYSHKHSLTGHMKKYHSSLTNEEKAIVNDVRRFPNVKEYRCKHCQAVFPYKYLLVSHLPLVHADVYRFSCDQCDKKYTNASGLRLHKEITHSDGSMALTCPYCGKGFPHKHYATTHYKYCQGKRDLEKGGGTHSSEPIQNISD